MVGHACYFGYGKSPQNGVGDWRSLLMQILVQVSDDAASGRCSSSSTEQPSFTFVARAGPEPGQESRVLSRPEGLPAWI